jgi:hypothetical protein
MEQLKNIFTLAFNDRVIALSRYEGVMNKRKRVTHEAAIVPRVEQFERIVTAIQNQRFKDHVRDATDLATFLGACGARPGGAGKSFFARTRPIWYEPSTTSCRGFRRHRRCTLAVRAAAWAA